MVEHRFRPGSLVQAWVLDSKLVNVTARTVWNDQLWKFPCYLAQTKSAKWGKSSSRSLFDTTRFVSVAPMKISSSRWTRMCFGLRPSSPLVIWSASQPLTFNLAIDIPILSAIVHGKPSMRKVFGGQFSYIILRRHVYWQSSLRSDISGFVNLAPSSTSGSLTFDYHDATRWPLAWSHKLTPSPLLNCHLQSGPVQSLGSIPAKQVVYCIHSGDLETAFETTCYRKHVATSR